MRRHRASCRQPTTPSPTRSRCDINIAAHRLSVDARVTLLYALRERIGLTGGKKGCDWGECGLCTVLADDRRVKSCLMLAVMRDGEEVATVRPHRRGPVASGAGGVRPARPTAARVLPGRPDHVRSRADRVGTPGPARSDDEICERMSGNLCRCGCYPNIVATVLVVGGGERH